MEKRKNPLWRRMMKGLVKLGGWWIAFTIFWVILLKWIPIWCTPTMFFRSAEAYFKGEDTKIYYEWVHYNAISTHARIAVVASEDQRFPSHFGLDFIAIAKAMEENKRRERPRGASTITQQVVKNVFLWQGGGMWRKALEVPFVYLVEIIWGKQRILEVYLNVAEMGPQTFGIQAASKRFFHKKAGQLTTQQAAILAAVLPSPRRLSAQKPSPYVIQRSRQIMYQMRMLGGYEYISQLRSF